MISWNVGHSIGLMHISTKTYFCCGFGAPPLTDKRDVERGRGWREGTWHDEHRRTLGKWTGQVEEERDGFWRGSSWRTWCILFGFLSGNHLTLTKENGDGNGAEKKGWQCFHPGKMLSDESRGQLGQFCGAEKGQTEENRGKRRKRGVALSRMCVFEFIYMLHIKKGVLYKQKNGSLFLSSRLLSSWEVFA